MAAYDDETASKPDSAFRKTFKFYRSIRPNESSDLIDFDKADLFPCVMKRLSVPADFADNGLKADFESSHLRWPPNDWGIYGVVGKPGFLFLRNPFVTPNGHLYWARRCLLDYAQWPHATNVDGQLEREGISVKDLCKFDDKKVLKKLRWVTLGYQHDWNTKVYSEENRSAVPDDLCRLSRIVAKVLFGPGMDFNAEAVIVNFYHMNSTLAGHVDQSERNFDLPLFSFSFGQSAVFLLGGTTLDETPIAVKIGSGDVVVMSGECRLAYHGVPRVFSEGRRFHALDGEAVSGRVASYLNEDRINMNVRQVN